jgi:hypothetical protein
VALLATSTLPSELSAKREVDDFAAATCAPLLGRHAQQLRCVLVEAPAGTEAGIVEGIGDALLLFQSGAQAVGAQRGGVLLGVSPVACLNRRCRRVGLQPAMSASSCSEGSSRLA